MIKGEIVSEKQILLSKTENRFNRLTAQEIKEQLLNKEIEVEWNNYLVWGITFFIKNDDKILLDVRKVI